MDLELEIEELELKLKKLERRKLEQEVEQKHLMEILRNEYGIKSEEEAHNEIEKLKINIEDEERKLEEDYNEFNEKYKDQLNEI